MPMVGGMKFPYTAKGKEDAKKAAAKKTPKGRKSEIGKQSETIKQGAKKAGIKRMLEKKKKGFSGFRSQTY
jgi:hypothetical protein